MLIALTIYMQNLIRNVQKKVMKYEIDDTEDADKDEY